MRLTSLLPARGAAINTPGATRVEVCPPSLRQAPESKWHRLMFWLLAPSPHDATPAPSRLQTVRQQFQDAVADLVSPEASDLWDRAARSYSLRDLWHLRPEVYQAVAREYSQWEAERRLRELNRNFPTRSPKSGFAPLI